MTCIIVGLISLTSLLLWPIYVGSFNIDSLSILPRRCVFWPKAMLERAANRCNRKSNENQFIAVAAHPFRGHDSLLGLQVCVWNTIILDRRRLLFWCVGPIEPWQDDFPTVYYKKLCLTLALEGRWRQCAFGLLRCLLSSLGDLWAWM